MHLFLVLAHAVVAASYPYVLTTADKAVVSAVVGDALRDGESARYRWPKQLAYGRYCGWVNAKNAYGAYVGFVQFSVIGGPSYTGKFVAHDLRLSSSDPEDASSRVVQIVCARSGYDTSGPPQQ